MSMLHKVIKGFEDYLITDTGMVYSLKRQKYLKPMKHTKGYYQVVLHKNGSQCSKYVHRLVAEAFIPNPDDKPEVDHINRIKTDNRVENLRWATRKEQQANRNLIDYATKHRKAQGIKITEIVDNKQIKYDSLRAVPNINVMSLSYHISKGETDFYVKQRNGKIRHFILPQNTENSNRKEETVNWV